MNRYVAARGPRAAPARAASGGGAAGLRDAVAVAGVEAQAGDHHERVTRVRVDRDPLAHARGAPLHEVAGVERLREQPGPVEGVADGARAVVPARAERSVSAAVAVGPARDLVRSRDRLHDLGRGAGRGNGHAVHDLALGSRLELRIVRRYAAGVTGCA